MISHALIQKYSKYCTLVLNMCKMSKKIFTIPVNRIKNKKKTYNDQLIGLSLNLEKRKRSLRDIKPKLKKQHRHNIQVTGMEQ